MYAVIGTAGHVDHGKSSLINALTGIHPAHLPEELTRSMTIDLGFAHFNSDDNTQIGIIDVPGHERFIRNMVSAVWGLDMVLFVVAADEGWARLSAEHLNIINALGVSQVILVINKCDLVDESRLHVVENQALEQFLLVMDRLPDTIAVSAHTGQGIDALKALIIKKVHSLTVREDLIASAHLYVDRLFSVSGVGTTVTGTLRGATIAVNQHLTLFPGNHPVKVRSLQSYHQALVMAQPYSRTAIGLKQVNKKLIQRGSCLVSDPDSVALSTEWIVQLNLATSTDLKKQGVVEVALGTTYTQAMCYVYAERQLARLQLNQVIPAFWGQKLVLIQQGGCHIIGSGRLLSTRALNRQQRQQLIAILPQIPLHANTHLHDRVLVELALNGFTQSIPPITKPDDTVCLANWWIKNTVLQQLITQCDAWLSQARHTVAVAELARITGYPLPLVAALVSAMCEQQRWLKVAGAVTLASRQDQDLPDELQALLLVITQAAKQGFDASKSPIIGINKLLRALTQRNLIVPTENGLFFSRESYQQLMAAILRNRQVGDIFEIAAARTCTGLSRKQLIPILNRLAHDGWVKRIANHRQVCRAYSGD